MQLDRRRMLAMLGCFPAAGLGASAARAGEAPPPTPVTGSAERAVPIIVTEEEARERDRLKALDLAAPAVAELRTAMPTARIGDLTVGRLICGSNLISINMHARDLAYVKDLAARYNTEERVFMTLKRCEELGSNTIVLKNHNFRQFRLSRYWDEWGGRMQWIADVITTDIEKYEKLLVEHLELGAAAAYLWGGASDIWYHEGKQKDIVKAYEIMRRYKIPVGIAAHRLEPVVFCEKEGLKPDFYMKTFHHDRYWSAHPKQSREPLEMYRDVSPAHDRYHDNFWCDQHEETAAFMRDVKVPWIAFKVMAAGAIPPADGISYAFRNGADFVCLGMFDFQVGEDALLVRKAIAAAKERARPWIA